MRHAAAELAGIFRRNRDTQMILFREACTHAEPQEPAAGSVASSAADLAGLLAGMPGTRADVQDRPAAARLLVAGLLMDDFVQPGGCGSGAVRAGGTTAGRRRFDPRRGRRGHGVAGRCARPS